MESKELMIGDREPKKAQSSCIDTSRLYKLVLPLQSSVIVHDSVGGTRWTKLGQIVGLHWAIVTFSRMGPNLATSKRTYQTQSKFLHPKVKFKLWKVYSLFPTEPSPYILDLVPQPLTAQQLRIKPKPIREIFKTCLFQTHHFCQLFPSQYHLKNPPFCSFLNCCSLTCLFLGVRTRHVHTYRRQRLHLL